MPTEPSPPTLAEVVRRAVDVAEYGEVDATLDELLERFEDADEPVSAVLPGLELRLDEVLGEIVADDEDPPLLMARALILYLAHRRDEMDDDDESLLRLAARAEFHGHPPEAVRLWLEQAGVEA